MADEATEYKLSLRDAGDGAVEPVIVERPAEGPTWAIEVAIEGPLEEASLLVGIQCKNMPVGSKVQFAIPSGTTKEGKPWEGADSGEQGIRYPNQSLAIPLTWPPDVQTTMTIDWWAEGTTPQPGATIEPYLAVSPLSLQIKLA